MDLCQLLERERSYYQESSTIQSSRCHGVMYVHNHSFLHIFHNGNNQFLENLPKYVPLKLVICRLIPAIKFFQNVNS